MIYHLTTCIPVLLQISHTCCKHQVLTKAHVIVASNRISLFCLEVGICIITSVNPLPFLIVFFNSIASSHCVEDTSGDTLVHKPLDNKYLPGFRVSQKQRSKEKQLCV